jgi:Protein of unknown function (DUF2934)
MRGEVVAPNNSSLIIRKKEMSMSSKPKGNGEPHAISAQVAQMGEASVGNAERDKEIRRRAYEIYLERGEQPGSELDDWLQAERELEGGVLAQAG